MKILWLCNIQLPIISKALNQRAVVTGGWLDLLSTKITQSDNQLAVSFPKINISSMISGESNGVLYYGIPLSKRSNTNYEKRNEAYYEKILDDYQPDIIHIWGTEFPRTLAMINVCEKKNLLDKVIVDLQGLCSIIAKSCTASLPQSVVRRRTLFDLFFGTGIAKQQKDYYKRGSFETEALKKVKRVMGRTNWDHACIQMINPDAKYHYCSRILRNAFYENEWDMKNCQKHSLFISQGSKPAKGLHYMLEAMPIILKKYPDAHLFVAGSRKVRKNDSLKQKLKMTGYGKYLGDCIAKYSLKDHVTFLGPLEEQDMCNQYLKTHVFVSASSMENSPNSVGEAMILGVPTVASNVGGVSSMLTHNKEGFLYQYDAPYMIAYYVNKVFEDDSLTKELSANAKQKARQTHDKKVNYERIMKLYTSID